MPSIVVPGAAQVTLRYTATGVQMINVYGAQVLPGTTVGQALADVLSGAIKAAYTANLATHHRSDTALQSVGIRSLASANLAEFIGTGAAVGGSLVADKLPGAASVCVTLRTSRSGQSYRGRTYLGGFTETDNDAGGIVSAALGAAAVAFVTAIAAAMTSNGLALGVLSRPSDRVTIVKTTFHSDGTQDVETTTQAARAGAITQVTAIELRNSIWDSQRRRASPGSQGTFFSSVAREILNQPPQDSEAA